MSYPCRGGQFLNIGLLHKSRGQTAAAGNWHDTAPLQNALDVIQDFHPSIQRLVSKARTEFLHADSPGANGP